MGRYFGTDGVRGVANADLTPELAFKIGRAGAAVIARDCAAERPIVVGRDTRLSGPMLEAAIVAGITSTGRHVVGVGVIPTPGIATITMSLGAAAGVMISASHNPVEDNGIKFFGADGFNFPTPSKTRSKPGWTIRSCRVRPTSASGARPFAATWSTRILRRSSMRARICTG